MPCSNKNIVLQISSKYNRLDTSHRKQDNSRWI